MTRPRPALARIADLALAIMFLAAIGVPMAATWLPLSHRVAGSENRTLAPFPSLAKFHPKTFTSQFESYFRDRFGFREEMLQAAAVVKVEMLGTSNSDRVILGRDGWLYYTDWPAHANFKQVRPFTRQELDHWQRVLEHWRDWLAERGSRYVLLITPDKQTIYPERVPRRFRQNQSCPRLDQLITHLREHSDILVVDVRPVLLEARKDHLVYFQTDSHWNAWGAFLGCRELAGALSAWFPSIQPAETAGIRLVQGDRVTGDLVRMLNLTGRHSESKTYVEAVRPLRALRVPAEAAGNEAIHTRMIRPAPSLPRALVFHDSFMDSLQPFLAEHFRTSAYCRRDHLDAGLIEQERPDVVIQQFVERRLINHRPNDVGEKPRPW